MHCTASFPGDTSSRSRLRQPQTLLSPDLSVQRLKMHLCLGVNGLGLKTMKTNTTTTTRKTTRKTTTTPTMIETSL